MITLIGRARMMWATVAPVARPLLASAAIGWGIAALGTIAEERRAAVDQLGDLVAERLASLDRYAQELAEAAKLERAYSVRLGELRAQLALAAADVKKSGIDEGTPDSEPAGVLTTLPRPRTEQDWAAQIAGGYMCACCNASTTPDGGGTHAADCPHITGGRHLDACPEAPQLA